MRPVTRLIAAAALAAACGAPHPAQPAPVPAAAPPAASPTPTPPPPHAAPAAANKVLYGPSAVRYVIHERLHLEQDYGMGTQAQDLGFQAFIAATVTGPADTAGYPATIAIDSVVLDSGAVLPPPLSVDGARGLAYRGRLTPRGAFLRAVPSDSARARQMGQLLGGFRNFYPRLPAAGAMPGTSWVDTTITTDTTTAGVITTRGATQSSATGYVPRGGAQGLEIHISGSFTVSGGGEANGQRFTVDGQSSQTGVAYVAADGRYLGAEIADSTDLAFAFVMGGRAPVRRVAHITVQVLP